MRGRRRRAATLAAGLLALAVGLDAGAAAAASRPAPGRHGRQHAHQHKSHQHKSHHHKRQHHKGQHHKGQRRPGPTPAPARTCLRPADVVDLTRWSVTLPAAGAPVTVKQPALATTSVPPYFDTLGCAVRFDAPVTSATTPNSKYPRSELREMTADGRDKAAWSSDTGRHQLDAELAFTRLPAGKPHLVGAQVHDAGDDVTTLRLEGSKLWISEGDHSHGFLVTDAYRLGTRVKLRFVVEHDVVSAYVDGRQVGSFEASFDGGYFKTGAYVQANCSNSAPCDASNGGTVLLYALKVTHTG